MDIIHFKLGLKLYKLQPSSDTKTENYSLKRFIKVLIHRNVATKKKKTKKKTNGT